MKKSVFSGMSFGLTSGIITTLGLMMGLSSSTHSKIVVIGGVLTIAISDAFSDALGVHISEESEDMHTEREIWTSTISTFASKFLFASTFLVPVILLDLTWALAASVIWGFAALGFLSLTIARMQGKRPLPVIGEHLAIAALVIVITHFAGLWIGRTFGAL
jgi:VIT1/CCC1 family predicted Fe2+/Mn2+ transporter